MRLGIEVEMRTQVCEGGLQRRPGRSGSRGIAAEEDLAGTYYLRGERIWQERSGERIRIKGKYQGGESGKLEIVYYLILR
jgi:hypothetical protein